MTALVGEDMWAGMEFVPAPRSAVISEAQPELGRREVKLTRASEIKPRPAKWTWAGRIPLGALVLIAGREGLGKSSVSYHLTAEITLGRLPGAYEGRPKAVIIAASEDSWAHTIVPRLMAAGANLDLVFRIDVTTSDGFESAISLPVDLAALEQLIADHDVALILLDPLMSRLSSALDTHKDSEVRQALEPLVRLADRSGASVLGLIHLNKSMSSDPLTQVMGSRAFAAVARAVLFVMPDPDDETTRLLGLAKCNVGPTDLPTLTFRIESAHVADTDEGPVWSSRINWLGESDRSVREVIEAAAITGGNAEDRTATQEAAEWLEDHLLSQGGTDESAAIKKTGQKAGHSIDSLKRARRRINATSESRGFPRRTYWTLPNPQSEQSPGESTPTAPTTPTTPTTPTETPVSAVSAIGAVRATPQDNLLPLTQETNP